MAHAGSVFIFFTLMFSYQLEWCCCYNNTEWLASGCTALEFCKSCSVWKIIGKTKVIRLDCSHSGLMAVPQKITKNLGALDLAHNKLHHLFKKDFRKYPLLTELIISQNNIQSIENGTFEGLTQLKQLILDGNKIEKLNAAIFRGLSRLKFLSLSANKIIKLPSQVLSGSNFLKTLKLDKNRIREIEIKAFRGLHRLESLSLRGNMLTSISRKGFSGLQSPSLRLLDLGENYIKEIEFEALQGVSSTTSLFLDSNRLKILPQNAWSLMHNLTELDVSKNNFNIINMDAFQELRSLERLRLDTCNISLIHRGSSMSDWPPSLKEFYFDNNPFTCDCRMRWLKQLSVKTKKDAKILLSSNNTNCSFPEKLKGQKFQNLPQENFLCSCQECKNEVHNCFETQRIKINTTCKCNASWEGSFCESVCQPKGRTARVFCHYKAGHCFCSKPHRSIKCQDDEIEQDIEGRPVCVCRKGLTRKAGKCIDIDECFLNRNGCISRNAFCINTHGSFHCSCFEGYSFTGAGFCTEKFNGKLAVIVGYSVASFALLIVVSFLAYYTLCRGRFADELASTSRSFSSSRKEERNKDEDRQRLTITSVFLEERVSSQTTCVNERKSIAQTSL